MQCSRTRTRFSSATRHGLWLAASLVTCAALSGCARRPPRTAPIAPVIPADSLAGPRTANPSDSAETHGRFYRGLLYGSESQFNPFSVFIYEGFDQLRTSPRQDVFKFPYGASLQAVVRSVVKPDKSIHHYGYSNWLRDEIFPLTLKAQGGGQWYPNYTLHLFGAGVTYVRLEDWWYDHGVHDHARLAAGLTTYAFHFLNEANENGPTADRGVDALSDLMVFDVASIIVWNQDWTRRLFSGPLEVSTWPGQASFGLPGKTIENAYSMFMLRAPLPRTNDWKLIVTQGAAFTAGLSRRVGSADWISAGAGYDAPANPVIDTTTGKKTATIEPNAGLFWDRRGSLLVAFIAKLGSNNGPTLNVYPGVLGVGDVKPGLWVQRNRGGGFRFGISSRLGFGVSTQAGIPRH
jgi:hypothetical protein